MLRGGAHVCGTRPRNDDPQDPIRINLSDVCIGCPNPMTKTQVEERKAAIYAFNEKMIAILQACEEADKAKEEEAKAKEEAVKAEEEAAKEKEESGQGKGRSGEEFPR
ncbi:hypothetical protein LEN26_003249 [Aphanomyces euteiches]|nr:hypothetical protein LEN26_003249 [Aphanomyces euteiches]